MSPSFNSAGTAGSPLAQGDDPHALNWQDVRELGLDPVPSGLTEDSDDAYYVGN